MNDYFLVTYYINWGLTGQKQIQQVLQLSQVNVLSMSSQGCYIVSVEKIEANPMFNTTHYYF